MKDKVMQYKVWNVVLILALIGSLGWGGTNYVHERQQRQSMLSARKKYQAKSATLKDTQQELSKTSQQVSQAKNQVMVAKNNQVKSADVYGKFNDVVKQAFNILSNFTPDSYKARKVKIKPLLSSDMFNQYFPNKSYVGDSNGVTSKLLALNIYYQAKQGKTLNGLVVAKTESRMNDTDFHKQVTMYQVEFDNTTHQITKIKDLGNSFSSDLIE